MGYEYHEPFDVTDQFGTGPFPESVRLFIRNFELSRGDYLRTDDKEHAAYNLCSVFFCLGYFDGVQVPLTFEPPIMFDVWNEVLEGKVDEASRAIETWLDARDELWNEEDRHYVYWECHEAFLVGV